VLAFKPNTPNTSHGDASLKPYLPPLGLLEELLFLGERLLLLLLLFLGGLLDNLLFGDPLTLLLGDFDLLSLLGDLLKLRTGLLLKLLLGLGDLERAGLS